MLKSKAPNGGVVYDLERRTTEFAKNIIRLCQSIPKTTINQQLVGQLVRAAGSIGANYREANDALGKKDFSHRLRIARKEAKETLHWLELVAEANPSTQEGLRALWRECTELKNILSAMITKVDRR